ncbi:2-dehydropantoate 2-reductase [Pseudonocardiaceae bacterium YIM PH 21723]|nr:2-dehydropantoate 2-reductase [Pseudonocardiaceae bacterium YIM PH 21723]
MRPWTVAVLGPGGVGGLLAALVARAGHRVICLAGEESSQVLRRDGIRLRSTQHGDFTARVEADTELREPVDLCLVTVKQTALAPALERVPPTVLGSGLVVPLLNGIEHPALLRQRYRPESVAPGVIRVEATRVAPGQIVQGSPFAEIDLASATVQRERLDAPAHMLTAAGVPTRVQRDETATLWAKMSFLAPLALLTTRYGITLGGIRTDHREELLTLLAETSALSRACGAPGDATSTLRMFDAFPAETKSSMQRDAEAGRPLELDAIGGALLRAAEQHTVEVPLTRRLMAELVEAGS